MNNKHVNKTLSEEILTKVTTKPLMWEPPTH